ncbi:MAG: hypothetical protein K9K38_05370 [Rhodoferax sp.]|nr:hypothetical protein [Rhodoferax sp.]MCF8208822.1 hypothetical protein [Rhodoferax sp.]
MAPFFENDELFGELISYARAVARRRGLMALDRLSFDLGIGYALVTGRVKVPADDLPLPNETVLFTYAQKNYCPLVDLVPSRESIALEESFRSGFVTKHIKLRSTLHSMLKDLLEELISTLEGLSAGDLIGEFSGRPNEPFCYSIIVAADRADFGLFLPALSADISHSSQQKSNLNRGRRFKEAAQARQLNVAVQAEGKSNRIKVAEKKKHEVEIDFGNPLGIPLVPEGLHVTPLPEEIFLDQNELRLYVSSGGDDKSFHITRLPSNPDVWNLTLPPGATLRSSAPIIRGAAARLFLLATVGRKKIEISNLLQRKHQHADASVKQHIKLAFPFDTPNNVLGAYFAFCLAIVVLCAVLNPAIALLGFGLLAWTVSRDVFNARAQLLLLASRLGAFWGPQLGLTMVSLLLGLWPFMANLLHVDFLSATLYGSIPLLFSFSLVALDFQPKEEKEAIEMHEEIHHALSNHMHEITQTALSVALGNLVRPAKPHAYTYFPEMLIKQLDKEIGTLEAVESFKRLISDRIKTTEAAVKKNHEGQQHARRTVMAAGGAIFTGFFAFEAGEKIIEFQHLQSKCDMMSFYHLTFNRASEASASATGAPAISLPKLPGATQTQASTEAPAHHGCMTYEDFHHHELQSTGMLLLATLLVSLLTAIVTIRKPGDEHGGGGEHHH